MSLAVVYSRARLGIDAPLVTVEVHLSNGLPSLNIVGMAETAVKESKDRVRSAIINSHFDFPTRRITVNLAPADLPKSGGQFDLAIALGILAASNQIPAEGLQNCEFMGELALTGELRAIPGCLPAAIACAKAGRALMCPQYNAREAALSEQTTILPSSSLLSSCAHLLQREIIQPVDSHPFDSQPGNNSLDLQDVKGQAQAKRALEIAAAGGHHLLLYGPPGTGKSMLASRLPGLLPPLNKAAAIEVACVQSLRQTRPLEGYPQRPFAAPHHTASAAALVGGGSNPQPGEISLAHQGILFLDELPEFQRQVLEVLREPLESGYIRISRARAQVEYPARFQLVAAMNPCPCGYLGQGSAGQQKTNFGNTIKQQGAHLQRCRCSPDQVRRYRNKISGPLLDRIDMHVPVLPLVRGELHGPSSGDSSATVQQRVQSAHAQQSRRQGCSNAQLSSRQLDEICPLSQPQQTLMENAMLKLGLSARALHRVLKVARSIADLEEEPVLADRHLAEAFSYRNLDRKRE